MIVLLPNQLHNNLCHYLPFLLAQIDGRMPTQNPTNTKPSTPLRAWGMALHIGHLLWITTNIHGLQQNILFVNSLTQVRMSTVRFNEITLLETYTICLMHAVRYGQGQNLSPHAPSCCHNHPQLVVDHPHLGGYFVILAIMWKINYINVKYDQKWSLELPITSCIKP